MLTKEDFKDSGHLKSGRYYLPEAHLLTMEGRKSGLLANLTLTASVNPCGATYQRCYSETPMIRYRSKSIDDLGVLRIQYLDNSSLFIKCGYAVGVIIPTETDVDWLITPSVDEKTIVELASSSEHNKNWSVITIPNPSNYMNHELYFVGHLDNDNILQDISNVLPPLTPGVTDEPADSLEKLGKATAPTEVGDLKMVVFKPDQQVDTPMEIGQMTEASKGADIIPKPSVVSGVIVPDDHDRSILPEVLDDLQLDARGVKDLLRKEDMYKYEGDEKFNPKSFKSGSSVGYIDRSKVTDEVLFAQIRMLRELMFNVIPLSRYNHQAGNGGSKVWAKWTAQTAVLWKTNMICPMSLPGMPGCWYPILNWTSKEMFIAYWQIYHIDQHTSRILCEHKKDGVSCHFYDR